MPKKDDKGPARPLRTDSTKRNTTREGDLSASIAEIVSAKAPKHLGANFVMSEPITIESLGYAKACMIFGKPLVDNYLNSPKDPPGAETFFSVTKIDPVTRTVYLKKDE